MKKIGFLSKIFLLFLFYLFISNSVLHPQPEDEYNLLSGINSLLAVFNTLEVESSVDEIKKLSDYDESKGTTIKGLAKAVRAKGLYALETKISINGLAKLNIPAIAYSWDNSFQAIGRFEQKHIIILTPGEKSKQIKKKDFYNTYSGFALLISKDKKLLPQIETKDADIRFEEYTAEFGTVKIGEVPDKKLKYIFKFRNTGKKELIISRVSASCGCTATMLSKKNFAPGELGEIKATFNLEGRVDRQSTNVYVFSNDPITPIVKLQIKATIMGRGLYVIPEAIDWGKIKRKSKVVSAKIYVSPPKDEELNAIKVNSSSKFISTEFSSIEDGDSKVLEIRIILDTNDIFPGELNEKITIYTDNEKYPRVEVPITGNIIGDIEIRPSKFFFGLAGEIRNPKVTMLNTGEIPLKIEKIENPLDFISVVIITKDEGKEYEIIATLKENTPPDNIKGNITVYTNNPEQLKIEIPVYCLSGGIDRELIGVRKDPYSQTK